MNDVGFAASVLNIAFFGDRELGGKIYNMIGSSKIGYVDDII